MKIAASTFSVVVGSTACNAQCPFCVSKMTHKAGMTSKPINDNWRNFEVSCRFAEKAGVNTAMLTGKGEPTLFLPAVGRYISVLQKYFPFIELQTNGIVFGGAGTNWTSGPAPEVTSALRDWYANGLTLICLSIVHPDPILNSKAMSHRQYDYLAIADTLHQMGFTVRVNCTITSLFLCDSEASIACAMAGNGAKCNAEKDAIYRHFQILVENAQQHGIEQVTVRDVAKPDDSDNGVAEWVKANRYESTPLIEEYVKKNGRRLLHLPHGANVYDFHGQNVSVNNCLTESEDPENIRQLIFFPDGHLRYSWVYPGAIIL